MIIIGVDPGIKGNTCIIWGPSKPWFTGPGAQGLLEALHDAMIPVHVFIEKAQAMPGQGVSSMFRYGEGYGELIGILKAVRVPYTCVHPRVWTKLMFQGIPTRFEGKARAAYRAAQLFPSLDLRATPRCKKPDEGKVDSLLIAEFGRRSLNGQKLQDLGEVVSNP